MHNNFHIISKWFMKSLSYEINQSNIIRKTKKGFRINLVKGIKIFLKKKKKQYRRKRYKNLSECEKQKLVKYRKTYYKVWKNSLTFSRNYSKAVFQVIIRILVSNIYKTCFFGQGRGFFLRVGLGKWSSIRNFLKEISIFFCTTLWFGKFFR